MTQFRPIGADVRQFLLVVLGWVIFRAPDLRSALAMYSGMFGFNSVMITPQIAWQIQTSELVLMTIAAAICFLPLVTSWRITSLSSGKQHTSYP